MGLRQADDALQELVAGRSADFRAGAGGTTLDELTPQMCLNCLNVAPDRSAGGGYPAVARLLR